jgi:amidase
MNANEMAKYDAVGLGELVKRKEVKPIELVEQAIRQIEALNPKLNAVTIKLYDLGRKIAAGDIPDGPFKGVPFLLKDLATAWEGLPVTNSSKYFAKYIAPRDWDVVRRIKRSGLVIVGKSNVPENGWSLSTEPKLYGPTRNPWNDRYSAGGSSGGRPRPLLPAWRRSPTPATGRDRSACRPPSTAWSG